MSKLIGPIVGILLVTLLGSGCVPFPVAPPEEEPFVEASEEWFTIGESTADDVESKLGEPTLEGLDWWLYRDTLEGWGWAFCAGGGFTGGCGTLPRSSSGHFFLIEFDSYRVITGFELFAEKGLCEERRICYSGEFLMRADAYSDDVEAKKFTVPAAGCSVYTYSQTNSDLAAGELVINGTNAGGLVGSSGFYLHSVAPGSHEWMIAPSQSKTLPLPAVTHILECTGQEMFFLRYKYGLSSFWFNKIEAVELKLGKKDIATRWLAASSGA